MKVFKDKTSLRNFLEPFRAEKKSIGLVPTMGALHGGHISLVETCKKKNDICVVSIFVNPLQFNDKSDYEKYPHTPEADVELLEKARTDVLFIPDYSEMYVSNPMLKFQFGKLEAVMEGAFRPGHFSGVGIVVSKLFNIIQPTDAYFGQKDFQQVLIVKQLVKDLSYSINIHTCPTMRDTDGLAMSSRNKRLDESSRALAAELYKSLKKAADYGHRSSNVHAEQLKKIIVEHLAQYPEIVTEYVEVAHKETLDLMSGECNPEDVVMLLACYIGGVRLIDNMFVKDQQL
ncbi:MAG: pantoate--beta-alanine ligase [Cytophagaceae bacterium]|nr:pantoate--beta-alanine ligase [Cytophagaceae bacterium]MDW8455936.1 pantoate--beta-alanine ligase [Cytophagaceae bacterium]